MPHRLENGISVQKSNLSAFGRPDLAGKIGGITTSINKALDIQFATKIDIRLAINFDIRLA